MKIIGLIVLIILMTLDLHAQKLPFDKNQIPQPVFDKNPALVDLYWKAWEMAYDHIKEQEGIPQSPYMDEAFSDNTIWIWDTEFMVLFCKYAPKLFPGIESLNNFYRPILNNEKSFLKIQHPDNPPFFAWVESDYYNFTNDRAHLKELLRDNKFLQRYYDWFESLNPNTKLNFEHVGIKAEKEELGYKWGGVQSGMDNTPRGRNLQGKMLWVDAIAQQALSALYISRLAESINEKETASKFRNEYNVKKKL